MVDDNAMRFKGRDVWFLLPALLIWISALVVSVWDLRSQGFRFTLLSGVGALLFVVGLVVRVVAAVTLRQSYSWTLEIREGHQLVRHGIYRYVRHPVYLGALMGATAVPVFLSSLLGFIIVLLAVPLFVYRIGVEEEMLIEEYGLEYREYMENSWKLLPFIY